MWPDKNGKSDDGLVGDVVRTLNIGIVSDGHVSSNVAHRTDGYVLANVEILSNVARLVGT